MHQSVYTSATHPRRCVVVRAGAAREAYLIVSRLTLYLLGPLHVTHAEHPVTGFESNKVRALLAYVAVEAERPHRREALAGLLWPEQPDHVARNNLRQALANLRQALADRNAQPPFLHISRETVQFNRSSAHWLDVAVFHALLAACHAHPHRHVASCRSCARRWAQVAELYRGEFLAQFFLPDSAPFEEWASLKREAMHLRALETLARLTTYHEQRGDYEQARHYAARQLELDPWREEAHRHLMRLLVRSGQRSAALVQYETCRRVLADVLGVEPDDETTTLYETIRDTAREAVVMSQPGDAPAADAHTLPRYPTSFVGRVAELDELAELLGNPACRLVTIVGPGGSGKTRLAMEAAAEQRSTFIDGVFSVPLAAVASAEFLVGAIADALKWTLQGQDDPQAQLLDNLAGKQLLLVLDNFEHLVSATLITEILQRAPNVQLLVTSRERLGLQWEWIFDIEGLDYPRAGHRAPLDTYSAVQLFTQRARQVRRHFALVGDDELDVARICRFVEGLPLGIELTAAAVRERSCREIADQIETNLDMLATSLLDVPARHRSMRAVFDHSWQLLSANEGRVVRQLSVFRGGFQEDAAAAVVGASLPFLSVLANKSLLRSSGHLDRHRRYDMHEVVRQYAFEQLHATGELEQTHERHLGFYLAMAEEAEPKLAGAEQKYSLERLEAERDNLRSALRWAFEHENIDAASRFGPALWRYWWIHGHVHDGRSWARQLLPHRGMLPPALAARALHAAGALASTLGDEAHALPLFEESLALYRALDNKPRQASILINMGMIVSEQGDYLRARALAQAGLLLNQELGDRHGIALAFGCLGNSAVYQGDYLSAHAYYTESLAVVRDVGSTHDIAVSLHNLGEVCRYQGDYAQASRLHAESLALFRALESPYGVGRALHSLAETTRYGGDTSKARALYIESLTLARQIEDQHQVGLNLAGIAALAVAQARPARVARLMGAAEVLFEARNTPRSRAEQTDFEQTVAFARAQMNETALAIAWAEGRAMTLDQAIAYALAEASEP